MAPGKTVADSLDKAAARVAEAAKAGARLVCLPELFATPYFCRTEDHAAFDLAEPIPGPTTEAMAVAVNVLSGAADCGLGIYAAARALDLDFVPLARERYDLVIPVLFRHDPKIEAVLAVVTGETFKNNVLALGGYETDWTGQEMHPGQGLPGEPGRV